MPALSTGPLDLGLTPRPVPDAPSVLVHVSCPISLELPAVPISLDLEGIGFDIPFALGGVWTAYLLAVLLYAAVSFFIVQRVRHSTSS